MSASLLLIEDNPGDARLIAALLEDAAAFGLATTLVTVDTLAAGIERLRPGGFELVLLDLGLPESSGLETVQRLRTAVPRLPPLVVLSGLNDEDVAVQALQAGAQDYLVKGRVEPSALARAIRYALGRHQAEQALKNELERSRELATERAARARVEGESESLRRLLDERDQLLRLLAHEVRQPLHNAGAALQSALDAIAGAGTAAPPGVQPPLQHAQQVMAHVIGTLNNALAAALLLTAGGHGVPVDTDLDTLVALVLGDIGPEDRGRVALSIDSGLRTAQLQPTLMRLALCNLLVNALKYSPAPAPVQLRIVDRDDPPALGFEVSDLGSGIDAALLPTVFDRGTRGPDARPGTGAGLGLYIVRQVTDMHRGSIVIEPNLPHGTIVRMWIPQGEG
ncbi:hybrid sensor histidine kinase/response regulator [Aquabacterium humicola]|uniref:hybrid sensor histidine kinase/response regulator n=1 Tax=Aquabacterium humicola TaxID=3237377 RepID=UPI002543E5A4|nr:ATP-binding protein [Rubrivivax pictus]